MTTAPLIETQTPESLSPDNYCHICIHGDGDVFCGATCEHDEKVCTTSYRGEAVCPDCGFPTCPNCKLMADHEWFLITGRSRD